jgi:hypothetical protein
MSLQVFDGTSSNFPQRRKILLQGEIVNVTNALFAYVLRKTHGGFAIFPVLFFSVKTGCACRITYVASPHRSIEKKGLNFFLGSIKKGD